MNTYLKTKYCLSIFLLFVGVTYAQQIEKSIYITANTWDINNTNVLSKIADDSKSSTNPTLLLLGNTTPKEAYKNAIDKQLNLINLFQKNAIIIPGHHEWSKNGHKGVKSIEKYIEKNSKAKFYPNNSEPIKHTDIGEHIILLTLDSQWFLEDWNRDTYINDDTPIQNRNLFFLEFENRIKKAQGKIVLVAIHHPIETNTKQGFLANTGGIG